MNIVELRGRNSASILLYKSRGRQMEYNYRHFHAGHVAAETARVVTLPGPAPGSTAPEVELHDTDGQAWRLRERRGTPVLLHFGSYS